MIGFSNIPKVLQFDHITMCDCPTKPIKFEFYKGDTINIIDKNGKMQGKWLTFYNTGEIEKQKYYKQGRFINGQYFDRQGKIIGEIQEGEMEIIIEQNKEK